MKKTAIGVCVLGVTSVIGVACSVKSHVEQQVDFTQYVNPFIGTGDHGHVFLGANVPYGMVQLGPSQIVQGWDWCSGYHYSDSTILGFSHTHLSGTGIGDLGDITLMPVTEKDKMISPFSHENETCKPGYYSVRLDDSGITAELTATQRTGMHRYNFPEGTDTAYVKLNLRYGIGWDSPTDIEFNVANDSTITGHRFSSGWAKDQKIYFEAQFSEPFISHENEQGVMTLAFTPADAPLLVKVGISPVSVENARENLVAENAAWDFDAVTADAKNAWNSQLAKITVNGKNNDDLTNFYTALYHTMTAPAIFSDVNGQYRGADGEIHSTDGKFNNYTIFSLWDTYRAAHPLSTLINPDMQKDYVNTFLNIYRQQGKLPVWHLHGNETDCMVGNPGVIVMGDLMLKGFVTDTAGVYDAMISSCMLDERCLDKLKQYGYIPFDAPDCNESVAKGLEYAIADDAVARVAYRLGKEEDFKYFDKRGKSYTQYFDSVSGFMRGKSMDGNFRDEVFDPFSASHRANDYCEGNGWQYVWLVPQDPHGLVELLGGEDRFVTKLDSLFTVEGNLGSEASPDISGLVGQYAHGNEPGHHTVYLYNYVGQPYKAVPILRHIMKDLYKNDAAGLCGNEDVGQMSAWFVLSSMGLYQVEPAGGRFVFGTPLFDNVAINVGDGNTFEILAHNNSDDNMYIQSAKLNGEEYNRSYIDYDRIMEGGVLEFVMGDTPSATFGVDKECRP
ncbi:MAG: GH92 family glycosyl hydrolase [Muribaculaceae bacterium]|nr:GH92 family glycosyl hydrolase [Muribaculaceae bacterium]